MSETHNPIAWLRQSGAAFDLGAAMGQQGRAAVHQHLLRSEIWARITSPDHAPLVTRMMQTTQARFPEFHAEISGLAHGLHLPLHEVYAWNCRGDLIASVPDGCTTLQTPGELISISHNEDGLPFFRGHCFIFDAQPETSTAFRAFCYPGSLPGHTFGWNDAGLVQAVNNLRLHRVEPMIPRMVLGRAVLASATLHDAIEALSHDPRCGGFHMTLAQAGNPALISIEYGAGKVSSVEITTQQAHTNHATHLPQITETTTQSSADRLAAARRLLGRKGATGLEIMRDGSGPGLPIWRDDPADPDQENTLATGVFAVSKNSVAWRIYAERTGPAAYQGETKIA